MNGKPSGKVTIDSESDIVVVRKTVREVTTRLGFQITDVTRIITAASELARNAFQHAGSGVMFWATIHANGNLGIELKFEDHGPGIASIEEAMQVGFSTVGGLGMGLPGAKRLMDEMVVESTPGRSTRVTVRKWLPR